MFTRRFDRVVRFVSLTALASFLGGAGFAVWSLWPSRQAVGYEPEQPFVFSHKIMAGDNKIPCLYCHTTAESGPHAGMPTVETCMNCHRFVQPKDANGRLKPDIAALLEHVDPKTLEPRAPIVWKKVHDLSDFAYFDHARHTVNGRIPCADCHGPVEKMTRVRRINSFKMGWCLECHRKPAEPWRTDGRQTRGPTHCSACHR